MQRVSLINSNNAIPNNDCDFTAFQLWMTKNTGGVLLGNDKAELKLESGSIAPGKAIVVCKRTTSTPIANQYFACVYENSAPLPITYNNGDKVYIEISENLVNDPTMIDASNTSVNYALGEGVGQIKSSPSYPNHTNYIKLYEVNADGSVVDKRTDLTLNSSMIKELSIDKLRDADGNPINLATKDWTNTKIAEASASNKTKIQNLIAGEDIDANKAYRSGYDISYAGDTLSKVGNYGSDLSQSRIGYNTTYQKQGVRIAPVNGGKLTTFTAHLFRVGAPTGNITAKLYSDQGATLLATSSNTIAEGSLSTTVSSPTQCNFTFDIILTPGTYYMELSCDRANNTGNYSGRRLNTSGGEGYYISSIGTRTSQYSRAYNATLIAYAEDTTKYYNAQEGDTIVGFSEDAVVADATFTGTIFGEIGGQTFSSSDINKTVYLDDAGVVTTTKKATKIGYVQSTTSFVFDVSHGGIAIETASGSLTASGATTSATYTAPTDGLAFIYVDAYTSTSSGGQVGAQMNGVYFFYGDKYVDMKGLFVVPVNAGDNTLTCYSQNGAYPITATIQKFLPFN